MENYANSMYYTFSTIAQVLAGFIALIGVFLIFKFQELGKMIFKHSKDFFYIWEMLHEKQHMLPGYSIFPYRYNLRDSLGLKKAEKLAQYIKSAMEEFPNIEKEKYKKEIDKLNSINNAIPLINNYRLDLTQSAKRCLWMGFAAILYSIIILSIVPIIIYIHSLLIIIAIYLIGILGIAWNIVYVKRLINKALAEID